MEKTKIYYVHWYSKNFNNQFLDGNVWFINKSAAKVFCEAMLEDKDIYKIELKECTTYIKTEVERNDRYEY